MAIFAFHQGVKGAAGTQIIAFTQAEIGFCGVVERAKDLVEGVMAEVVEAAINPDARLGRERFEKDFEISCADEVGILCRHGVRCGVKNVVQEPQRRGLEVHRDLLSNLRWIRVCYWCFAVFLCFYMGGTTKWINVEERPPISLFYHRFLKKSILVTQVWRKGRLIGVRRKFYGSTGAEMGYAT